MTFPQCKKKKKKKKKKRKTHPTTPWRKIPIRINDSNVIFCCEFKILPLHLFSDAWFICKSMALITSSQLHKVINAHVHAITAMFPKTRYLVGYDANLIFWPLRFLPTWMSDFILKSRFIYPIGHEKTKTSWVLRKKILQIREYSSLSHMAKFSHLRLF